MIIVDGGMGDRHLSTGLQPVVHHVTGLRLTATARPCYWQGRSLRRTISARLVLVRRDIGKAKGDGTLLHMERIDGS